MKEIIIDELNDFPKEKLQLVDIRDEGSIIYGMIPGAIHIAYSEFSADSKSWIDKLSKDKKIVLYCQRGEKRRKLQSCWD